MMSDYGSTPPPPPPPPGEGQGSGQPQGMQGMPSYENAPSAAPVERPASIAQAVKLMYVGAGLSVIGLILAVADQGAIRDAVEKSAGTKNLTPEQVDSAVTLGTVTGVIGGLIGVALWVWMAAANGKGRKWAKVLATVFYGLYVLSFLFSFLQPGSVLTRVLGVITVVLGGYILYLLYRPESTQYYEAQSAPRI